MPQSITTVLVGGSTGYLGRHVVAEAGRRGYATVALARSAGKLADVTPPPGRIVQAEATSAEALRGCCEGVDVVFSALGITRQADGLRYDDVDYGANLALLREAERAGVRRFVYVSVLHPEHTRHTDMVAAKERFVAALRQSQLEAVIVRPTGFFSDMTEFLRMAEAGRVWVFGDGGCKINPIHGADLAAACVDAFAADVAPGERPIGGPETLTQREIGALACAAAARPVRVTGLPLWLIDALLWVLRPLSRRWWNILAFMSGAGRHDMVGPAHGSHRLADHFAAEHRSARAATGR